MVSFFSFGCEFWRIVLNLAICRRERASGPFSLPTRLLGCRRGLFNNFPLGLDRFKDQVFVYVFNAAFVERVQRLSMFPQGDRGMSEVGIRNGPVGAVSGPSTKTLEMSRGSYFTLNFCSKRPAHTLKTLSQ